MEGGREDWAADSLHSPMEEANVNQIMVQIPGRETMGTGEALGYQKMRAKMGTLVHALLSSRPL